SAIGMRIGLLRILLLFTFRDLLFFCVLFFVFRILFFKNIHDLRPFLFDQPQPPPQEPPPHPVCFFPISSYLSRSKIVLTRLLFVLPDWPRDCFGFSNRSIALLLWRSEERRV